MKHKNPLENLSTLELEKMDNYYAEREINRRKIEKLLSNFQGKDLDEYVVSDKYGDLFVSESLREDLKEIFELILN